MTYNEKYLEVADYLYKANLMKKGMAVYPLKRDEETTSMFYVELPHRNNEEKCRCVLCFSLDVGFLTARGWFSYSDFRIVQLISEYIDFINGVEESENKNA